MEFDSSCFQIRIAPHQQLLFPSGGKIKIQLESSLPFLVTDECLVLHESNQIACETEMQRNSCTASVLFKDSNTGVRYVTITVKNMEQTASTSCVYYVYKHKNAEQTIQYLQSVIMHQRDYVSWNDLLYYLKNLWHHKCYKDARKASSVPSLCEFDWFGMADTLISSKTKLIASLNMITRDEVKGIIKWLHTLADKIQLFPDEFWTSGMLMTCSSNQAKEYLTLHPNHVILRFSSEGTFQLSMLNGATLSQGCIENTDFFVSFLSQDMFKNYFILCLNENCRRFPQQNNQLSFTSVELNTVLETLKKLQKPSNYTLFPALNMVWNFNIMSYMPSFFSGYSNPTPTIPATESTQKKRRLSDSVQEGFTVTTNSKIADVMEQVKQQLDLPPELCADIIAKFHKEGFIKMLPLQHLTPADWKRLALPLAVEVHLKQLVQQMTPQAIHSPPMESPMHVIPSTETIIPQQSVMSVPQYPNSIEDNTLFFDQMIPIPDSINIFSDLFQPDNTQM